MALPNGVCINFVFGWCFMYKLRPISLPVYMRFVTVPIPHGVAIQVEKSANNQL